MKVKFFEFIFRRREFLKKNANEDFVIEKGEGKVILSAPHGVSQVRLGKHKHEEPGSLALMLEVQKHTNAHMIAKTRNCNDDANFDEICPYKDRLKKYIQENDIKYLIDFHGMDKKRDVDVNLGTYMGQNIKTDEKLFDSLKVELDRAGFVVSVDEPFWGGANTVSGTMAKDLGIWTIQLEVNFKYTNEKKYNKRLNQLVEILTKFVAGIQK